VPLAKCKTDPAFLAYKVNFLIVTSTSQ